MVFKLTLTVGFVAISILVLFWSIWIVPQISHNVEDFSFVVSERGFNQIVPSYGEDLGEPFDYEEILRHNVISQEGEHLEIDLSITGKNLSTSELIFAYSERIRVDRFTHTYENNSGEYFTFPPNVKKQDYDVSIPFNSIPAKSFFQKTEKISNLETYLFLCESKNNDVSDSFPQFYPYNVFIDYQCLVNVEPKTGNIVDFELDWDTYFVENGTRTLQAEIGGVKITEFSSTHLIENTQKQLQLLFIYEIIVPIILIVTGIGILITTILFQKTRKQNKLILKARDELIKNERLSMIGELSSRLAHDIRNPLTVIKTSVLLLRKSLKDLNPDDLKKLEMIDNASSKMKYLVENVLDFVRSREPNYEKVSFLEILDRAKNSIHNSENIEIKFPKNDIKIECDPNQIEVVLENLFTNSVQSIGEDSGKITVSCHEEKDSVLISIQDTGKGIPENLIPKIFDPLFSTKKEGTGLGLASCKSIIDSHKGTLNVFNNPTTFVITIPKLS